MMTRPDVSFALVEAGPSLGGNRTWSYHGTDVTKAQREWLWALSAKSWPSHDVAFGDVMRRIGGGYHSITSSDFNWKLGEMLKDRLRLRTRATEVTATSVTLKSGEVLEATAVIDGRGLSTTPDFSCGYQKFLGLDVELDQPHGLEVPLLMDARVEQHGAFRFVYLLPWTEKRVLVEDTYYADDPSVDLPLLRGRIENYLALRGLKVARVLRQESAALPIPFDGQAPTFTRPTVGVAAGLFNATTGYSLPLAVEVADAIAARKSFEPGALTAWLRKRAEKHWRQQSFQRLLNRMLFRGAEPEERVKVFTSFYQHGDGLISRFYAGKLNALDKLFVLARGAPSVPGPRAIRAALGDMSPL
jgi:lycopene beta-cyclase